MEFWHSLEVAVLGRSWRWRAASAGGHSVAADGYSVERNSPGVFRLTGATLSQLYAGGIPWGLLDVFHAAFDSSSCPFLMFLVSKSHVQAAFDAVLAVEVVVWVAECFDLERGGELMSADLDGRLTASSFHYCLLRAKLFFGLQVGTGDW